MFELCMANETFFKITHIHVLYGYSMNRLATKQKKKKKKNGVGKSKVLWFYKNGSETM